MSIQLTNEQLMIYLENQNKQTQHNNTHNFSHRDPEKTGIHVFDKNRENIYEYLALFDTLVEGEFQGDTTKALQALLTRFTSQDILRLGSNVNSANYQDIRDAMYSKLGAHLEEKDMSLTGMSLNKGEHITDYFTRLQHRWKGYNDWLTTEKRNTKTDNEFIETFIETLPHQYRQILALEKVKGKIETIKALQSIIDKYKFVWKNTQHTTQNNDLQKLEDQLQKTENTIHNNLLPKLTNIEQHFTKTIESKLQTYHNEITQQQQQLNEISTTNTKQFKEISKATEKTVELIAETNDRLDNENKYRSKLEHQTKLEQNSLIQQINNLQEEIRLRRHNDNSQHQQLNNMHSERDNRIRQRETYTPYNNQNTRPNRYQNFQRSQSSDDSERSDSSRSRTPSPNPLVDICHACIGEHWLIRCPDAARLEKENELFKLMAKKKEQYAQRNLQWSSKDEAKLRAEYGIEDKQNNPSTKHDQSKTPPGTGRYCKWEHIKGHATLLCPNFCPLCEKHGHGWQTCPDHKAAADKRTISYRILMSKLAVPYTPYKRDTNPQRNTDYRREHQPYNSRPSHGHQSRRY